MKRNIRNSVVAVTAGFTMMATLTACGNGDSASEETSGSSSSECASDLSDVTVGFVAVGPEGAWREANEKDVQTAFAIRMLFTHRPVDRYGASMFLHYQRGFNVKFEGIGANQY